MFTHYLRDYNCLWLKLSMAYIFRGKFFLFQDACLTRASVFGGLFGFAVNDMAPSAVQPTTEYFSIQTSLSRHKRTFRYSCCRYFFYLPIL